MNNYSTIKREEIEKEICQLREILKDAKIMRPDVKEELYKRGYADYQYKADRWHGIPEKIRSKNIKVLKDKATEFECLAVGLAPIDHNKTNACLMKQIVD